MWIPVHAFDCGSGTCLTLPVRGTVTSRDAEGSPMLVELGLVGHGQRGDPPDGAHLAPPICELGCDRPGRQTCKPEM